MARSVLHGLGASPGIAVGRAVVVRDVEASTAPPDQAAALAALEQAAAELGRAAEGLREAGLADEAEILEANRLMAEDPSLAASVRDLAKPLIGVVFYRAHLVAGNTQFVTDLCDAI